jgi:hypothetical protein
MLIEPGTAAVGARWLDGTPASSEEDLRGQLADFVVREPAFARNAANRVWEHLFGRALAEPVDDAGDAASHPELLAALARFFVESGHDLRVLLREITRSRTYQRSCRVETPRDERLFTHAIPRPLDVDQLFASLQLVTGIDPFARASGASAANAGDPATPATIERPPSRADLPFLAREMEGLAPDPSVRQPVFDPREFARIAKYKFDEKVPLIFGGDPATTGHALVRQNLLQGVCNRVAAAAVSASGDEIDSRHVDWLWRSLLSRPPTQDEIASAAGLLERNGAGRALALADLAWVLLNSQEFSNNH